MPNRPRQFRPAGSARPTAAARGYASAAWRRTRLAVIARDSSACRLCGRIVSGREAHVDHVREKSLGGDDSLTNLRLLCVNCHSSRHSSD